SARRPAAALEDLLRAEIRLGVFLVRVANEPRIGLERIGDPLPDVSDHLPAAEGAIACRERSHVHRSPDAIVKVGLLGARRRIAPGAAALGSGPGVEACRHLPFGLARQPAVRPLAEGLGLPPAHASDWMPGAEGRDSIEQPLAPGPFILDPEQRA